jgi:hypothetical protein
VNWYVVTGLFDFCEWHSPHSLGNEPNEQQDRRTLSIDGMDQLYVGMPITIQEAGNEANEE